MGPEKKLREQALSDNKHSHLSKVLFISLEQDPIRYNSESI